MSRIGVTRIDFPVSALALAISAFDDALVEAFSATLTGLRGVSLRRCVRTTGKLPGGRWQVMVRHPWPATSAVVVEGTGETIERAYADFGKGRVGLPQKLLLALLAAKVEGVTAETVLAGTGQVTRWMGTLDALCTYLVGNPPALAPV